MGAPIRYRGVPINLGGETYTVPAMNAGTFEDFEDRIAALQAGTETKPVNLVVDLLHRCLLRNYPGISRETLRDHVDLDNWAEIFAMIMGQSGYKRWLELEATQGNPRALQLLQEMQPSGAGAPSTHT